MGNSRSTERLQTCIPLRKQLSDFWMGVLISREEVAVKQLHHSSITGALTVQWQNYMFQPKWNHISPGKALDHVPQISHSERNNSPEWRSLNILKSFLEVRVKWIARVTERLEQDLQHCRHWMGMLCG